MSVIERLTRDWHATMATTGYPPAAFCLPLSEIQALLRELEQFMLRPEPLLDWRDMKFMDVPVREIEIIAPN